MTLFFKGLAFGFILAATVGPMWVLCFGRTIRQGALTGFAAWQLAEPFARLFG